SFFLANTALRASPGLEMRDKSIFGATVACEARDCDALPAGRERSKRARTLTASSSSSELECVFPAPRPSSANASRTSRLLTSNSRARSLIRILLIRLFSSSATQSPLDAHGYLTALAAGSTFIITRSAFQLAAGYLAVVIGPSLL